MRTLRWVSVGALVVGALSCGGGLAESSIGPSGGEVCITDQRVCIEVPLGALERQEVIRISTSDVAPEAILGDSYDISPVGPPTLDFAVPAIVKFKLDYVPHDDVPNDTLLRIYTFHDGEWQSLENASVDRVKGFILGETHHLSPFCVLRADLLPDGGSPFGVDAGPKPDSGVIVVPPLDASTRYDAGTPDAGRPDAGTPDAGTPDAGRPDAGPPDAGPPDAGPPDAGPPDAGPPDAGPPDAGPPDAGPPDAGVDAGQPDAGDPDAGADAGQPDAGDPDAGADGG